MQTFGTHPLFWATIAFVYLYLVNVVVVSVFIRPGWLFNFVVILSILGMLVLIASYSLRPAFCLFVVSMSMAVSIFADTLVKVITGSKLTAFKNLHNFSFLFAVVTSLIAFMLMLDTLFPPVSLAERIGALL